MMAQSFAAQVAIQPGHPGMQYGHPIPGAQHPGAHMGGHPGAGMMQGMHPGVSGPQVTGPMATGMPPGPGTPAPGGPMQQAHAMAHLRPAQQAHALAHLGPTQQAMFQHQSLMARQRQQMLQAQQQASMSNTQGISQAQLNQMRANAQANNASHIRTMTQQRDVSYPAASRLNEEFETKHYGLEARHRGRMESSRAVDLSILGRPPERERKEEIKRIKEAEQDALAKALGFEVTPRNPNMETLGNRKEVDKILKEAAEEEEGGEGAQRGRQKRPRTRYGPSVALDRKLPSPSSFYTPPATTSIPTTPTPLAPLVPDFHGSDFMGERLVVQSPRHKETIFSGPAAAAQKEAEAQKLPKRAGDGRRAQTASPRRPNYSIFPGLNHLIEESPEEIRRKNRTRHGLRLARKIGAGGAGEAGSPQQVAEQDRDFEGATTRPRLQPVYPVDEVQDLSPEDYLSQLDLMSQSPSRQETEEAEQDEMAYSPDDEITLEGGLGQTGEMAELVRWKNGKGISLRTNEPYAPLPGIKRQHSSESMDEDVTRSMARRKKNAEPRIVELKCSDKTCDKTFNRKSDLAKHEKTHSRPFKCPVEDCRYHEQGLPTEKERERHVNDKHAANPKYYHCTYCPFKTKRDLNCKQHMEKKHGWQYDRVKGNARTVRTPAQTPQTPSMEYSPSVASPAPSNLAWGGSSTSGSVAGSAMVTPLDHPMHDFNAYSPPSTPPFTLFQRKQPTSMPVLVTLSAALKRGESQTQDLSYLSTPRMADFALQMPYSSSPTTSDAGLTTASTATSPAMSRSNINGHDMLSRTNMLRVNSTAVLGSTNGNTTMFTPYTISEDRTGSQESVTRQRLSALGDRSRKREMQEFSHLSARENRIRWRACFRENLI